MKIISLNLHSLKEDNQESKLRRVAEFIRKNDIDVCLFQEVSQHKDEEIIYDNVRKGSNIDMIYRYIPDYHLYFETKKYGFAVYEEGLAILTKNPLNDKGYAYISKTHDQNNWLTRITVYGTYDSITFYNIHLGWTVGDEVYEGQVDRLSEMALKHDNLVMIIGDYNACAYSKEYNYFIQKGFYSLADILNISVYENPTFNFPLDNGQTENRVIDHVFINKKIKVKDYKILFSHEQVSDHNMIYIEV